MVARRRRAVIVLDRGEMVGLILVVDMVVVVLGVREEEEEAVEQEGNGWVEWMMLGGRNVGVVGRAL